MERAQSPFCGTKRLVVVLSFIVAVVFLFLAFRPPPPPHGEGPPKFRERPDDFEDKPNKGGHGGHGKPPKSKSQPKAATPKEVPQEETVTSTSAPTTKPKPSKKPVPVPVPVPVSQPKEEETQEEEEETEPKHSVLQAVHKQRVKDYCKLLTNPDITGCLFEQTKKVEPTNGYKYPVYAYTSGDIVSTHLTQWGRWEDKEFNSLRTRARTYAEKKGLNKRDLYFVDIGANLGVFCLGFAHEGFSVFAFEAGIANSVLINRVLCDVPEYQDLVTLFDFGLGKEEAVCSFYSDNGNKGDGHLACTPPDAPKFVAPENYVIRDTVNIMRLDDVLNDPDTLSRIVAVKMDTEGFEALIVQGGQNFFNSKIPYIFSEAEPRMVAGKGGGAPGSTIVDYWTTFKNAGYWASCGKSNNGPLMPIDVEKFGSAGYYDCLLVHESVKDL